MPTNDLKDGTDILYICGPDGKYYPASFAYIGDACNALDVESTGVLKIDIDMQERILEMNLYYGTNLTDMALILMGFNEKKIRMMRQNNWRRMHGIPMKRRKRR